MEIVYERIFVSHEHSFITRRLQMSDNHKVHSHKNYELNYISAGSGKRIVGSSIMSYSEGDLVLLGPDIPHCWDVLETGDENRAECIVTHFYENIIHSDFIKIPELEKVVTLLKNANTGIWFKNCKKSEKVGSVLKKMTDLTGLELYIGLLQVFNLLLQIEEKENLTLNYSLPDSFDKDRGKVDRIYNYVFQNIRTGISLKKAAELLYMEPGSFCRYFRKKTGQTFIDYVKSVRISIAARMLAQTDKQITRISYECGYNNIANFNHYFREIMQQTPSEYRKSFR